jgi:hypothetical protein
MSVLRSAATGDFDVSGYGYPVRPGRISADDTGLDYCDIDPLDVGFHWLRRREFSPPVASFSHGRREIGIRLPLCSAVLLGDHDAIATLVAG